MGIISWVVLGLIAGFIAKKIMSRVSPATEPKGCLVTTALGVGGAALGGLISSAVFKVSVNSFFSISTWLIAILGSIVVLYIYHRVVASRTEKPTPDHGPRHF